MTAATINCKGTLMSWDSTAVGYMDVVSRINYILTNLQQLNTMLTAAMDAEDALANNCLTRQLGKAVVWVESLV